MNLRQKKQYFTTKSCSALISPHTPKEFNAIIEMKKEYQTLIKKQLQMLDDVENAELKKVVEFQHEIEMREGFKKLLTEESKDEYVGVQQNKVGDRGDGYVECYEVLVKKRKQNLFKNMLIKMKQKKQEMDTKRASTYLYQTKLAKNVWKGWMSQSMTDNEAKQQINQHVRKVQGLLKKENLLFMLEVVGRDLLEDKAKDCVKINKLRFGKKRVLFFVNYKTQQKMLQQKQKQLHNWQQKSTLLSLLSSSSKIFQTKTKQKLLQNISLHRHMHTFIKESKRSFFIKQSKNLKQQIGQKIILSDLMGSSINSGQNMVGQVRGQSGKVNVELLDLIVENVIDEFMMGLGVEVDDSKALETDLKQVVLMKYLKSRDVIRFFRELVFQRKNKSIKELYANNRKDYFWKNIQENRVDNCKINQLLKIFFKSNFRTISQHIRHHKNLLKLQKLKKRINKMMENQSTKGVFLKLKNWRNRGIEGRFREEVLKVWRGGLVKRRVMQKMKSYRRYEQEVQLNEDEGKKKNTEQIQDNFSQIVQNKVDQQTIQKCPNTKQQLQAQNNEKEGQQKDVQTNRIKRKKRQLSKLVNISLSPQSPRNNLFSAAEQFSQEKLEFQQSCQEEKQYCNFRHNEEHQEQRDCDRQGLEEQQISAKKKNESHLQKGRQEQQGTSQNSKIEQKITMQQKKDIKSVEQEEQQLYLQKTNKIHQLLKQNTFNNLTKNYQYQYQYKVKLTNIMNHMKSTSTNEFIQTMKITLIHTDHKIELQKNLLKRKSINFILHLRQFHENFYHYENSCFLLRNFLKIKNVSKWCKLMKQEFEEEERCESLDIYSKTIKQKVVRQFFKLTKIDCLLFRRQNEKQEQQLKQQQQNKFLETYSDKSEQILQNYLNSSPQPYQQQYSSSQQPQSIASDQPSHTVKQQQQIQQQSNLLHDFQSQNFEQECEQSSFDEEDEPSTISMMLVKEIVLKTAFTNFCEITSLDIKKKNIASKVKEIQSQRIQQFFNSIEQIQHQNLQNHQIIQKISYCQRHHAKNTLKRSFNSWKSLTQISPVVSSCFKAWLMYYRQKKMLKKYLTMQEQEQSQEYSYYPASVNQKQDFQALQQY